MKRLFVSLMAATVLAATLSSVATQAHPGSAMRIISVSVSRRAISKAQVVTFRVRVSGIVLDAIRLGRANVAGHGHLQVYADRLPSDAYARKDLKHEWLATLAAPDFSLRLSPAVLGGKGRHKIIIALAQNDDVLYRTPSAAINITVT